MITCRICGVEKAEACFYERKDKKKVNWRDTKKYWRTECIECTVESRKLINNKKFQELLKQQNGVCWICKKKNTEEKKLCIDHDHKNGKIRRLLCTNCNTGLGLYKDDIGNLNNAIAYLKNGKA